MLSVLFLEDLALVADAASSVGPALASRLPGRTAGAAADSAGADVFEGAQALDRVAGDWEALEAEAGAATPFQSLAMARAATAVHLQAGEIPRIAVVRHGGRPVVILPTVVGTRFGVKVARFLGDPLIQYGDALCEPGTARRHLEAAFRVAADPAAAGALHLRKVRADARIAPLLRQRATAFNHDEAPFLDIAGVTPGFSTLVAVTGLRLGAAFAAYPVLHTVLKSAAAARSPAGSGARARSGCSPRLPAPASPQRSAVSLHDALGLKRRWLEARRLPSSVIGCEHWEAAIERLAGQDGAAQLNVATLHVGDRPAAYEIAFAAGGRWYAFMGAIVEDFARHSPGRVQVADTIAWCRSNGFDRYDLLAPADDVKRSYCRETAPVCDYAVALRPAGHFLVAAVRLTPAIKTLLARLPPSLRKAVLSLAGR